MKPALVKVQYVGGKPFAYDNVARSGKQWAGKGDVQEVTPAQAKLLLQHPGQWALLNPDDASLLAAGAATVKVVDDNDGEVVQIDADAMQKRLENMTKTELKAYAKTKYGKDLDARKPRTALIDEVREFEATVSPITGVAEDNLDPIGTDTILAGANVAPLA
jgi:hypothetical protein